MIRRALALLALLPVGVVPAAPWEFGPPVTFAGEQEPPHYHHLDAAGRQHLAAGPDRVAVVWEDDRSGAPQVYVAVKERQAGVFGAEFPLSNGGEAFEPVVVALGGERFLAAWEQDGGIWGCLVGDRGPGPRVRLAAGARQVTLAAEGRDRAVAVWAADQGQGQLLQAADLALDGDAPVVVAAVEVAPFDDHPYQGYPSAAFAPDGRLVVAWEDRRAGHTRLFHAYREPGQPFVAARQLNEHTAPRVDGAEPPRLGSGVMRVAVAGDGPRLQAVWMDKRNPNSGYAVWGAASGDGGRSFAANQRVQDELGAAVPQWHAGVTAGDGVFVAAWDDTREGWGDESETGDVLLSWNSGEGWSADLLVPGASGEGYQGSPALAIDPAGDLHLVWIEREDLSGPTRLRYLRARRIAAGME